MSRLDVRSKVDLPVNVVHGNGGQGAEKSGTFSVLSLNGAHIDYKYAAPKNKLVNLRYDLPKHGEFEMLGEVIRKDKKGIIVKFHNVNRDTKINLWDYIKDNMAETATCPYCGKEIGRRMRNCEKCGWSLDFYSPDYLVQHEKESFVSRLSSKSKVFNLEDIYRILNFIDVEILGIGKSMEINEEFVGSSKAMLDVFSMIRRVAPTDLPVIISGENGTGKHLTARAIYERSPRKEGPFVPVNCSAIPEDILEMELFGFEKGAFREATNGKIGKLEFADGGTIFFQEIGELPPNLQSKLLRFLEDKIVERIGAKGGNKVDVRLIASSTKKLKSLVSEEKFSKELFYRLDAFSIDLSPLRERGDDKMILARYFLNKFSREMNVSKTFTRKAIDSIRTYEWPGNVREMINKVRRGVVMSSDSSVTEEDLDIFIPTVDMESILSLRDVRHTIERQKLKEALSLCNNNISKTAKVLGISRPSVYNLKRKFGL